MRVGPGQSILEIGCGHGVAAGLICRRLQTGHLIAIDRSAKMIDAAIRRNRQHVDAGLVEFFTADVEDFDPRDARFDTILAVRVGFFHREPQRALRLVRPWLKPGGRIIAEYDEPGVGRA